MILQQRILSFSFLPTVVLSILRLPTEPPDDLRCSLTAASRYLRSGNLLCLCPELNIGLHRIGKWSLSATLDIKFMKKHPFSSTIICPEDEYDLGDLLDFVTATWRPEARFLVVVLSDVMEHKSLSEGYLQQLWERKTIHAAVLIGRGYFTAYAPSPFYTGSQCGLIVKPKLTNVCYNGLFLGKRTIFPDILKDLNGCPLRVSTIALPPFTYPKPENSSTFEDGIEIRLLNSVAKKINATIVYKSVINDGFSEDPWTEMLTFLLLNEADIAVSHFAPFRQDGLTNSEPYFEEKWSFIVPKAMHGNGTRGPLSTLSSDMKLAIGVTFVVLRIVSQAFQYSSLHLWAVLIGVPIPSDPQRFGGKSLMLSWLLTSLVIRTVVTSSFFTSLTVPLHEKDISTIEELLGSGLDFGGHWARSYLFCSSKNDMDRNICQKYKSCTFHVECFTKVAHDKNFAFLGTDKSFYYESILYYKDSKGMPLIAMLEEKVWTTPVVAVMRQGTIFFEKFNSIVRNLLSGGLLLKFESDTINMHTHHGAHKRYNADDEPQIVTLDSLTAVFTFCVMANGVATVVFILEILLFRYLEISTRRNINMTRKMCSKLKASCKKNYK